MAFLEQHDPSRAESSIIIDSILTYYSGTSDSDQRSNSFSVQQKMVDSMIEEDIVGEFPLPPLNFTSKPVDWLTMSVRREPKQPSNLEHLGGKDSPTLSHEGIRALIRNPIPSRPEVEHDEYLKTLSRSSGGLAGLVFNEESSLMSPRSSQYYLQQKPTLNTNTFARDFVERYPAIDQSRKTREAGGRDSSMRRSPPLARDYRRRPSPPSQKGTFASPFPPNSRATNYAKRTSNGVSTKPSSTVMRSSILNTDRATHGSEDIENLMSSPKSSTPSHNNRSETRRISTRTSQYGPRNQTSRNQTPRVPLRDISGNQTRRTPNNKQNGEVEKTFPPSQVDHSFPTIQAPPSIYMDSSRNTSRSSLCSIPLPRFEAFFSESQRFFESDSNEVTSLARADFKSDPASKAKTSQTASGTNTLPTTSTDRQSLIEQGNVAQNRRTSRARSQTTGPIKRESRSSQSQYHPFPTNFGKIEHRHANVNVVSPKPERPLSRVSSEDGLRRLLSFEKYLEEDVQSISQNRLAKAKSQLVLSMPKEDAASRFTSRRFSKLPSVTRSKSTASLRKGQSSWPLPPYPVNQGSGRLRSHTQPNQPSPWKSAVGTHALHARMASKDQAVPPVPSLSAHWLPSVDTIRSGSSLGIQHAIDEALAAQKEDSSKAAKKVVTGTALKSPPVAMDSQKKLPDLPADLDTSAIATFPTSKEVPLPEFVTAETPRTKSRRRLTGRSTPRRTSAESLVVPFPDFKSVKSMPSWNDHPSILTEEGEPSVSTRLRKSTERSIPDAFVMYLESGNSESHHPYRWSANSGKSKQRNTTEEKRTGTEETPQASKPSRGCGPGWTWFWHKLSCSSSPDQTASSTSDSS